MTLQGHGQGTVKAQSSICKSLTGCDTTQRGQTQLHRQLRGSFTLRDNMRTLTARGGEFDVAEVDGCAAACGRCLAT